MDWEFPAGIGEVKIKIMKLLLGNIATSWPEVVGAAWKWSSTTNAAVFSSFPDGIVFFELVRPMVSISIHQKNSCLGGGAA